MNVVFPAIVLLSVLFAAWSGSPSHPAEVEGVEVRVDLGRGSGPSAAAVAVGSSATVESAGVRWPGVVVEVSDGVARVETLAPDGFAAVRFDDQYAMRGVSTQLLAAATRSMSVALDLVGSMCLFLGLLKVVEAGGGLAMMARVIRPLMVRLFPSVPADHPAMGAMILNLAANALGLGNAATPFGVRAMEQLDTLNREKGTATNAMVLFLAINTSGVTLLPTDVIAVRAAAGAADAASVVPTTLLASCFNSGVAVLAALLYSRFAGSDPGSSSEPPATVGWQEWLPFAGAVAALGAVVLWMYTDRLAGSFIVPGLVAGMLGFGVARGVPVYERFIEGAKEGFGTATRIVPYVVAILVSVAMFRASGGLERFVGLLGPAAEAVGVPREVLPLALLRPLSGSSALALTTDITRTYGPDSFAAQVAGTLQCTTETTFYVLAVYFGAVGVKRVRHAVATGLTSDLAGVLASAWAVRWLIGP